VGDDGVVFRALADPTRRAPPDRLREHNGEPLAMARQSATSIWPCWRRPASSPPSAGAGRSCTIFLGSDRSHPSATHRCL